MRQQRPADIPPWMLFAFPAAIAVPVVAASCLAEPSSDSSRPQSSPVIVVVAIRMEPRRRRRTAANAVIEPRQTGVEGWRGAAARRFLAPLAIAVPGIVLIATTTGTARVIGWGLFAVAITVAISLVFLEIGYSEDRARAREERGGGRERHGRPVR